MSRAASFRSLFLRIFLLAVLLPVVGCNAGGPLGPEKIEVELPQVDCPEGTICEPLI